jgi:hypothetical protein
MDHYLMLHADLCDLDFAEFSPDMNLLSAPLLADFSSRRELNLSQLKADLETRMASLNPSLALQQFITPPLASTPSEASTLNMHKMLLTLKNYPNPSTSTGDTFWLDLQRHADANGISSMKERLAHLHQSILNHRPLMDWFDHTIQPLGNNLTLDVLQTLVFTRTLSHYKLSARLIKLCRV